MARPAKSLVFLRLAISVLALFLLFVRSRAPYLLPPDSTTVLLLVLAIVPWLGRFFDTAEFGGWKFKFIELEAKANKIEKEIDRTRQRIDYLFVSAMSSLALTNLQKIASGSFGPYFLGKELTWELLYFVSLGYVSFKRGGINDIPENGHAPQELNLSDYIYITTLGQEYLALRQSVENPGLNVRQ